MRAILRLVWRFVEAEQRVFLLGVAATSLSVIAAVVLLGLSGWFITATAAAGLAGIGIGFDVFRPGAAIRFLAILRTASRYGERLLTHDALLRFTEATRLQLFRSLTALPFPSLAGIRSAVFLNRLTGDLDALDSFYLRMLFPLIAAGIALSVVGVALGLLVHPLIGAMVFTCHLSALAWVIWRGWTQQDREARMLNYALDSLRVRTFDIHRGRLEAIIYGHARALRDQLDKSAMRAHQAGRAGHTAQLQGISACQSATLVSCVGSLILAAEWQISAEFTALAILATIGLPEILTAVVKGASELGRAKLAATRLDLSATPIPADPPMTASVLTPQETGHSVPKMGLYLHNIRIGYCPSSPIIQEISLTVCSGSWVAVTGPSGCGKSTLLTSIAGLQPLLSGQVWLDGTLLDQKRGQTHPLPLGYLRQSSALFAGSVRQNLLFATPEATDEELWAALSVCALSDVVQKKGGLCAVLGPGGSGLSGGERRRLCLARLVVSDPKLILLDEPTEGLDEEMAHRVLTHLRRRWSDRPVLCASHRPVEVEVADRLIKLPVSM